jgi:hypothetical protein
MTLSPPFMPHHGALLVVLAVGGGTWLCWRHGTAGAPSARLGLLALRAGLLVGIGIVLLNPVRPSRTTGAMHRPAFVVLLDASRSMRVPDVGGHTRSDAARALVVGKQRLMEALSSRYDLRLFTFAGDPYPTTTGHAQRAMRPDGPSTDLGAALRGAVGAVGSPERGIAHVLLVSDGRDTTGSYAVDAARSAHERGYSVHTLCLGAASPQTDLALLVRQPVVVTSPGRRVWVSAQVRDAGVPRLEARIRVLCDGRPAGAQAVTVGPGISEARIPIEASRPGLYRYALRLPAVPGESDTANNNAEFLLQVLQTTARVLMIEGIPSWDTRFLADALRRDPGVTVDVYTRLTDARTYAVLGRADSEEGGEMPRTSEELARYDVAILGRGLEAMLGPPEAEAVRRWVAESGGALVFLRGRAGTGLPALAQVAPLDWAPDDVADLRLRLTQEGSFYAGFVFDGEDSPGEAVGHFPALLSASRVTGEKALAVVLARAEGWDAAQPGREMALVAYHRYGQGVSMAIGGEGLWRWAFRPATADPSAQVYARFWHHTMRWLASAAGFLPGRDVSLRADRAVCVQGEPVLLSGGLRGRMLGSAPALVVDEPGGRQSRLIPGLARARPAEFTAAYRPTAPGTYIVRTAGPGPSAACGFDVRPAGSEEMNTSADPELMREISSAGGGMSVTPADVSDLPERLAALEAWRSRRQGEPATAWDRAIVLGLLLGLLVTEWLVRMRRGLL